MWRREYEPGLLSDGWSRQIDSSSPTDPAVVRKKNADGCWVRIYCSNSHAATSQSLTEDTQPDIDWLFTRSATRNCSFSPSRAKWSCQARASSSRSEGA